MYLPLTCKIKLCRNPTYIYACWHATYLCQYATLHIDIQHINSHQISCNNVALPYLTFGYLSVEGYNSVGFLLWRKNILMHYLVFPMISINCKYISFNPNVPCLNVILTNSLQNFTFCHVYYREIWGSANHPNESICKTHYSYW